MRCRATAAALLTAGLALSGCAGEERVLVAPVGEAQGVPASTTMLRLEFEDLAGTGAVGPGATPLVSVGERPATVRAATSAGGRVRPAPGPEGEGLAARFPAFDPADPRTAVLTVALGGEGPGLDPGLRDFAFGVDFALDPESEGSRTDNGNNLVQRGLFVDNAQYKLQVEKGQVSCRIAGDAGEVVVKSVVPIEPGEWYRASCSRLGDIVSLELGPVGGDGRRVVASGATGSVRMAPDTPLVIGGKASARGEAVRGDSDQFNGRLDNVHLDVGPML